MFGLELFYLFFDRFLETRPTFFYQPRSPMTEVWMHMFGVMIPKRAQLDYPARISDERVKLLGIADDHMFVMVSCPYAGMDWQGCANILFTNDETHDDKGNINVFFKLI